MEKYGILKEDSVSDFDTEKRAEYIDRDTREVADEANKDRLSNPIKLTWTKD